MYFNFKKLDFLLLRPCHPSHLVIPRVGPHMRSSMVGYPSAFLGSWSIVNPLGNIKGSTLNGTLNPKSSYFGWLGWVNKQSERASSGGRASRIDSPPPTRDYVCTP